MLIRSTKCIALTFRCGSTADISTQPVGVRQGRHEGSVCEGAQDEEAILLLPDPLQQFVDSSNSHRLCPQRTEAEVDLEAAGHPCQQVFSFTAAVEEAERSGWVVQAAVKVLVQTHNPVLLFLRLVHSRKLWTGVQSRAL